MVKRNKVAITVAAILGSAMRLGQADAQEATTGSTDDEVLEEVVITGLRASLQASMETKRNAIGVVDAISAEDIGKFPDTNLSEALQRITGISISRAHGEGHVVTARGFGAQYNMVTLNGRMMPAADAYSNSGGDRTDTAGGTTRSFNFANLASDAIRALEVYKTSRADIATGGIGATINIVTDRPLDDGPIGFSANLGGKLVHDDTNRVGDDLTPEVSGIFSYVNDDRTFGVSLSASNQQRDSGASGADVNDWRVAKWVNPGEPGAMELAPGAPVINAPAVGQLYALPNDLRYSFSDRSRERTNAQLTLQFKPVDTLKLTADYTFAENHLQEHRGEQTTWFVRTASAVEFDTDNVVATPVMISENVGPGKDFGFEQQYRDQTNTLRSLGFNADWQATDRLRLAFDIHDSSMESLPSSSFGGTEVLMSIGAPIQVGQTIYYNSGLPIQTVELDDSHAGNGNGVFDAGDIGTQQMRIFYNDQVTEITQARIDGELEFDNGRFQFGVETRDMTMRQRGSQNQWQLGDWGVQNPGEIPENLLQRFNLVGEFDDFSAPGAFTGGWKADAETVGRWAAQAYGVDFTYNPNFDNDNRVEEDTRALYAQVQLRGQLAGRPTSLVLGARYESTDVTSTSARRVPTAIVWTDNNDYRIERATDVEYATERAHYNHLLPSLSFDVDVTDDIKARFAYSKTIARAQYDQIANNVNIPAPNGPTLTNIQATANMTNPHLVPLESDNFDLSIEWYFGPQSYVSAGFFEKRVSNFIGNETVEMGFFGLRDATAGPRAQAAYDALVARPDHDGVVNETELFVMTAILDNPQDFPNGAADYDPSPEFARMIAANYDIVPNADDPEYVFLTQRPINNREARIHGFEIGGQHFFGNTGFGILANYTIVRGDIEFDINADPAGEAQFALLGLSDSANVVLMYEKYGWSARLAYNWRDKYLSNANRGSFRNPVFVEEYEQIDLSISYHVTDSLTFTLEGLNLTGEDFRSHGRSPLQLWYLEEQGPRYAFGVRYKF